MGERKYQWRKQSTYETPRNKVPILEHRVAMAFTRKRGTGKK